MQAASVWLSAFRAARQVVARGPSEARGSVMVWVVDGWLWLGLLGEGVGG
jgi:hypothetical protein